MKHQLKTSRFTILPWLLTASSLATLALGCADDDTDTTRTPPAADEPDSGSEPGADSGSDSASSDDAQPDAGFDDSRSDDDSGTGEDSTTGDSGADNAPYPSFPDALALTGCEGIGPLCTAEQDGDELTANCGGVELSGSLSEAGHVTLTSKPQRLAEGQTRTHSCEGSLSRLGQLQANCTVTTIEDDDEVSESCQIRSKRALLPSVECMELPSDFSDFDVCIDGDEAGGETISLGSCRVVQDGCDFQADCENGKTLTGSATMSGISFTHPLVALQDAEAPADGGDPQFSAGETVAHRCTAELNGGALVGECAAGRAGRGGTNTSVCAVGASASQVTSCEPLSPRGNEQIFALDSCDNLKYGAEGEPGIGEPLCAFRQNNCIWEVQCGRDMVYSGRVDPRTDEFEWRLETNTRCEGRFSESGEFAGVCAVPDLFSCDLWSKPADPGGDACPSAPIGETVTSRGCGNGSGDAMDCRELAWHGCNFMALCSFASMESLVFAGTASEQDGVGRLDLQGIGDWSCYAEAPTTDDLASDPYRASNEWLGQCDTEEGGQCRDTFDPQTGEGFRGLQLFWGAAEALETDAGAPNDAGADAGE